LNKEEPGDLLGRKVFKKNGGSFPQEAAILNL
jgi:hypothetical protein